MNELRTVAQSVAVAAAAHHSATRAITGKDNEMRRPVGQVDWAHSLPPLLV
jgi:hypothetical protein